MEKFREENIKEKHVNEMLLQLFGLIRLMLQKKLFVSLVVVSFISLLALYSFLKKPAYTAKLSFALEVDATSGPLLKLASIMSQVGMNSLGTNNVFNEENIQELLKSRLLIEKTLFSKINISGKQILLLDYYIQISKLKEQWKDDPVLSKIKFTTPDKKDRVQDSIIGSIYLGFKNNLLNVSKVRKDAGILQVSFKSNDEVFSKEFTERLVTEVIDFYIASKTDKNIQNRDVLLNRLDSVKNALEETEITLARLKDSNKGLVKAESYINQVRLTRQLEILNIMYSELVKNLEVTKFMLLQDYPLIQIIDKPTYPLDKEDFGLFKAIIVGFFMGLFFAAGYLFIKGFILRYFREIKS